MIPQKQITRGLRANINLIPEGDFPAYYQDGVYTTRWKLTLRERIRVFLFGNIWLNVKSDSHPPVRLDADAPYEVVKVRHPDWGILLQETSEQRAPTGSDSAPGEDDAPEFEDEEEERRRKGDDDRGFFS